MRNKIDAIRIINLSHHMDKDGRIVVIEGEKAIPFEIKRIFLVQANKSITRGKHAHKLCSQILICSYGSINVKCTDGNDNIEYLLDQPDRGLLVPPGIWCEQHYIDPDSQLTVLCDELYNEDDYIRDYDDFIIDNYNQK